MNWDDSREVSSAKRNNSRGPAVIWEGLPATWRSRTLSCRDGVRVLWWNTQQGCKAGNMQSDASCCLGLQDLKRVGDPCILSKAWGSGQQSRQECIVPLLQMRKMRLRGVQTCWSSLGDWAVAPPWVIPLLCPHHRCWSLPMCSVLSLRWPWPGVIPEKGRPQNS